jgi:hypothetical protein
MDLRGEGCDPSPLKEDLVEFTYFRLDDYSADPRWAVLVDGRRHGEIAEHGGGWPIVEHPTRRYYRVTSAWPGVTPPDGRYDTRNAAAAALADTNVDSGATVVADGLTKTQRAAVDVAALFPSGGPDDGTLDRVVRERLDCTTVRFWQILRAILADATLAAAADRYDPATTARLQRRLANLPHRSRRSALTH